MAAEIKLSTFASRVDTLLQGVPTADLSAADRQTAVRQAIAQYNIDLPKRLVAKIAGDGGRFYPLYAAAIDRDLDDQDAEIAFKDSGADQALSLKFTIGEELDLHALEIALRRIGSTVEGTLELAIYTADGNGLPDVQVLSGVGANSMPSVDIDDVGGAPAGIVGYVRFDLDPPLRSLRPGTYCVVLTPNGYTYNAGSAEVRLGVTQAGAASNEIGTYDGSAWSAYGTDSLACLRVWVSLPGWQPDGSHLLQVEYPAAALGNDEEPNILEDDTYSLFEADSGDWLCFESYAPPSSEHIRLWYTAPYQWTESSDPTIAIPSRHFEAVCNLAASFCCTWLATRYGQNTDSTFVADVVDQRTQDEDYRANARDFYKAYLRLTGLDRADKAPGLVIGDVDQLPGFMDADFIFHGRTTR